MSGWRAFRAGVAAAAVMAAGPGIAYEIAPDCQLPARSTGGDPILFYAEAQGTEFVTYYIPAVPVGRTRIVLEHCPSTQRMTAIAKDDGDDSPGQIGPVSNRFVAFMEDDQRFTLNEIADGLAEIGAKTSVQRTNAESCPCRLLREGRLGQGAMEVESWEFFR